MCGRFGLTNPRRLAETGLLERLDIAAVAAAVSDPLVPRYNVAPSQPVLAVLEARPTPGGRDTRDASADRAANGEGARVRTLAMLRWGLVPRWAKDVAIGHRLANARAETLAEKPAFRDAWARGRRCAILADVFYEWQDAGEATADPRNADPGTTGRRPVARRAKPRRQPWAIRLADGQPFAFAGLWERWRDPAAADAEPLVSCTLVTTAPNALMQPIHDRMPVLLTGDALGEWLDGATTPARAAALLAPYGAARMEAWPIGAMVNTPANDDVAVLEPAGAVVRGAGS